MTMNNCAKAKMDNKNVSIFFIILVYLDKLNQLEFVKNLISR